MLLWSIDSAMSVPWGKPLTIEVPAPQARAGFRRLTSLTPVHHPPAALEQALPQLGRTLCPARLILAGNRLILAGNKRVERSMPAKWCGQKRQAQAGESLFQAFP